MHVSALGLKKDDMFRVGNVAFRLWGDMAAAAGGDMSARHVHLFKGTVFVVVGLGTLPGANPQFLSRVVQVLTFDGQLGWLQAWNFEYKVTHTRDTKGRPIKSGRRHLEELR
jgi:hypothetical protein